MNIIDHFKENLLSFDTVSIIGKGKSLQYLNRNHISGGAIIAINQAIAKVEKVGFNNLVLSMQKDGGIHKVCDHYVGVNVCHCKKESEFPCPHGMVLPTNKDTILLTCENCSSECYESYPTRLTFNTDQLGLNWDTPSVLCAIELAKQMGAFKINLLCFDSFTQNDFDTYNPIDGSLTASPEYGGQHEAIKSMLMDVQCEFITPMP